MDQKSWGIEVWVSGLYTWLPFLPSDYSHFTDEKTWGLESPPSYPTPPVSKNWIWARIWLTLKPFPLTSLPRPPGEERLRSFPHSLHLSLRGIWTSWNLAKEGSGRSRTRMMRVWKLCNMRYGKRNWKRFTLKGGDTESTRTRSSIISRDGRWKRDEMYSLCKQKADFCWENEWKLWEADFH